MSERIMGSPRMMHEPMVGIPPHEECEGCHDAGCVPVAADPPGVTPEPEAKWCCDGKKAIAPELHNPECRYSADNFKPQSAIPEGHRGEAAQPIEKCPRCGSERRDRFKPPCSTDPTGYDEFHNHRPVGEAAQPETSGTGTAPLGSDSFPSTPLPEAAPTLLTELVKLRRHRTSTLSGSQLLDDMIEILRKLSQSPASTHEAQPDDLDWINRFEAAAVSADPSLAISRVISSLRRADSAPPQPAPCPECQRWKDASGLSSPEELDVVMDKRLDAIGLNALTDAVDALTPPQPVSTESAEYWKTRCEMLEQEHGTQPVSEAAPSTEHCPQCGSPEPALMNSECLWRLKSKIIAATISCNHSRGSAAHAMPNVRKYV